MIERRRDAGGAGAHRKRNTDVIVTMFTVVNVVTLYILYIRQARTLMMANFSTNVTSGSGNFSTNGTSGSGNFSTNYEYYRYAPAQDEDDGDESEEFEQVRVKLLPW